MALGLLLIRFDFLYRKVLRKRSLFRKVVTWMIVTILLCIIGLYKLITTSNHPMAITKDFIYIEPLDSFFRKEISDETKDWADVNFMEKEKLRVGFGEKGMKTFTSDPPSDLELRMMEQNGHNAFVSDKISVDRSVADFRSPACKEKVYRKHLPKVSVIIPFFDEHFTTLLRTIHSVVNRSPKHLLKEIILVNDASTKKDLYDMLEVHIKKQPWGKLVKLLMMNERVGLIWSRLAGARYASGDVLLFLDCHMEAGYNYLPPLIDPIVLNYRAVVTPALDVIDKHNYGISPIGEGRTVFDWNFHVQRIPLKAGANRSEIHQTPIMYGAAFAISAKFYWELQPDSGLTIYGGDQLEMSLKINLCGGTLYEAPCSRIAHLYRRFPYAKHQHGVDYKARNNKRVAEIWLDDYKKYFYDRHSERYENLEIGDISKQMALKKKLSCRPFHYFFDHIAPDMLERFPLIEPQHFALGTLRNIGTGKCVDVSDRDHGGHVRLARCSRNKTNPMHQQNLMLRHYRDIQVHGKSDCLEGTTKTLTFARCHYQQGNQYFRLDAKNNHIFWGGKRNNLCMDGNYETDEVFLNYCDEKKESQKWVFGFARTPMLKNWTISGAPILDPIEIEDLKHDDHHIVEQCKGSEEVKKV